MCAEKLVGDKVEWSRVLARERERERGRGWSECLGGNEISLSLSTLSRLLHSLDRSKEIRRGDWNICPGWHRETRTIKSL